MANYSTNSIDSGSLNDLEKSVDHAKQNRLLLDNISKIYNFENKMEFPMHFLRKYENIFKTNLIEIDLAKKYWFRPEYLSQDIFDTVDLWYLILFVNDMKSPMDLCTEKILIPNNDYSMEVVNKLKMLEKDVETSHKEPIYIERQLIKDLNENSEIILDLCNDHRNKNIDEYEEINPFINPYVNFKFYVPIENFANITEFNNKTQKVFINSAIYSLIPDILPTYCFGSNLINPPDTDLKSAYLPYISLPTNNMLIGRVDSDRIEPLVMDTYLEKETNYVLIKRYNGDALFQLIKDFKYETDLFNENIDIFGKPAERILFDRPIMTYDLRESCLLPEYIGNKYSVCINGQYYEPTFYIEEDRWGIKFDEDITYKTKLIIDKEEQEVKIIVKGKEFYPVELSDYKNIYVIKPKVEVYREFKDENIDVIENFELKEMKYFLLHKSNDEFNEKEIVHSNEIFLTKTLNNLTNVELKQNEDINYLEVLNNSLNNINLGEMYFNKEFGGYIIDKSIIVEDFKIKNPLEGEGYLFQLMIDIENDLKSNNIDINNYEFLGFDLYYYFRRENFHYQSISPLSVTYEVIENNEIKYYSFTLPFDENIEKDVDYSNNYNGIKKIEIGMYQTDTVSNIKRILPIIYDCENKKHLKIKKIYVSVKYKCMADMIDEINIINSHATNKFSFGLSGFKLYGFKYDEIVQEFNLNTRFHNPETGPYRIYYRYLYEKEFKGPYFEPSILKRTDNLIEKLMDRNEEERKSDYIIIEEGRRLKNENGKIKDPIIFNYINENEKEKFPSFKDNVVECFLFNRKNEIDDSSGYKNLRFNEANGDMKFNLDYNYKIELEISYNINYEENSDEYRKNHPLCNSFKFGIGNDTNYLVHLGDKPDENNENETILYSYKNDDKNFYIIPTGLYLETYKGNENHQIYKNINNFNIISYTIKKIEEDFNYIEYDMFKRKKIRVRVTKQDSNIKVEYSTSIEEDIWSSYQLLYSINDPLYPFDKESFNKKSKETLFKIINYLNDSLIVKINYIKIPKE